MQDFTGIPAIVDLAAMRDAMESFGADPSLINPRVPVDLIVDHSVIADVTGRPDAFRRNAELEFTRNRERIRFLMQPAVRLLGASTVVTGLVGQEGLVEIMFVASK